jgi:hypothetical protein
MDTGPTVDPRTRAALRRVRRIVSVYLIVGVLTVFAVFGTRNTNPEVYAAAVGRCVGGTVIYVFSGRAARGLRAAFTRVRIVSGLITVTVLPVLFVPGHRFPEWMKVGQAAGMLIMLSVVVIVNGRHLRSVFADGAPATLGVTGMVPAGAIPVQAGRGVRRGRWQPAVPAGPRRPYAFEDPNPTIWLRRPVARDTGVTTPLARPRVSP